MGSWDGNSGGDAQCQELSWERNSSVAEGFFLALMSLLEWVVQGFLLLQGHVGHKVHHYVAVAVFIVVTGNELYEVVTESNASPGIKGGRVGVTVNSQEGDNLVPIVAQETL